MKKTIGLMLVLVTLTGCHATKMELMADIRNTCDEYGYTQGTSFHSDCMMEIHQNYYGNPNNTQKQNVKVKIK